MTGPTKTLLVTGFGPFSTFTVNPSTTVVELLRDRTLGAIYEDFAIQYKIIPTNYDEALALCHDMKVDFSVHIGVHENSKSLQLERTAFAHGYERLDVCGKTPLLNCCDFSKLGSYPHCLPYKLTTVLHLDSLRKIIKQQKLDFDYVEISDDPGAFLCSYIYYNSLLHNDRRSLFLHIPPFEGGATPENLSQTLAQVIKCVIQEISKI